MNNAKLKIFSTLLAMGVLTGCADMIGTGSEIEKGPVSTGKTIKELKSSPCACTEIMMNLDHMEAV